MLFSGSVMWNGVVWNGVTLKGGVMQNLLVWCDGMMCDVETFNVVWSRVV